MTPEEKELLLKDLSARIPYQPLCKKIDTEDDFCECDGPLGYSLRDFVGNNVIIKPYLRPMSSMTEEEENEYRAINCYEGLFPHNEDALDYVLEHHFDYRGLIDKGLALEASEGMYENF